MSQEHIGYPYDFAKHDPIEEFWAVHGPRSYQRQTDFDGLEVTFKPRRDQVADWRLKFDPWCNGRYALAALAWGLIFMLVVSVMA
jgi:hypothetical protein